MMSEQLDFCSDCETKLVSSLFPCKYRETLDQMLERIVGRKWFMLSKEDKMEPGDFCPFRMDGYTIMIEITDNFSCNFTMEGKLDFWDEEFDQKLDALPFKVNPQKIKERKLEIDLEWMEKQIHAAVLGHSMGHPDNEKKRFIKPKCLNILMENLKKEAKEKLIYQEKPAPQMFFNRLISVTRGETCEENIMHLTERQFYGN